ncbi:hypothetical protein ACFQ2B_00725 [Streptomyces stramineus]
MLDPLLKLAAQTAGAGGDATARTAADAYDESVDAMDVDDLVRAALDGNAHHERD